MTAKTRSVADKVFGKERFKQARFVRLGNLAKLQRNGKLNLDLPGYFEGLTATATHVRAESETNYEWFGTCNEGRGYVHVLCRDGKITANISPTGHKVFEVYYVDGDVHVVYSQEPDPTKADCLEPRVFGPKRVSEGLPKLRTSACPNYGRVLVLYTPAAQSAVPDISQTAQMAVSQFNACVYNSNVTHEAAMFLAGVAPLNFQGSTNNDMLEDVRNILPNNSSAQSYRSSYNADIIVLLTDNPNYQASGAAANLHLDNSKAYAIVQVNDAVGYRRTFAHEVGHLYTLRHDNDFNNDGPGYRDYAHGYVFYPNGTKYVTIMSSGGAVDYPQGRLLNFSNPNVQFNGVPMGTFSTNNCALRVGETYSTVNSHRSDPQTFQVGISGPYSGYAYQQYTWNSTVSCTVGTYSYQWRTSYDGFNYSGVVIPIQFPDVVGATLAVARGVVGRPPRATARVAPTTF